jgi:hypothetical protein
MTKTKEADLYAPLKVFLQEQGYEVKGEVHNCDVVAKRGDDLLVVELKLSLNLTLLLQAVDRLALTKTIYVGVPKGIPLLKKNRKQVIKLMRMLGLGLLSIDPKARVGNVDVLCEVGDYRARQVKRKQHRVLREFEERQGDPSLGGSSTKGDRMTAYRQKAIAIAKYLNSHGESKASLISKELAEPKARNILYDNVYGWFTRLGLGIYDLSDTGKTQANS